MTQLNTILSIVHRSPFITSNGVAERLGVTQKIAAAALCDLHKRRLIRAEVIWTKTGARSHQKVLHYFTGEP